MFGRMIRRKVVNGLGAERGGGLLHVAVELTSTGCTVRTTNGSVTNSSASADARPGVGEVDVHRAVRPVERQQHQAGDDRRQRERQVDERVDHALAREAVAHQHPGDQRAHHAVDQRDEHARRRWSASAPTCASGRGDRVPEAGRPVLGAVQTTAASGISTTIAEVDDGRAEPDRGPDGTLVPATPRPPPAAAPPDLAGRRACGGIQPRHPSVALRLALAMSTS